MEPVTRSSDPAITALGLVAALSIVVLTAMRFGAPWLFAFLCAGVAAVGTLRLLAPDRASFTELRRAEATQQLDL